MAKALTVRAIEALPRPDKRTEIPDGVIGGLYLVAQPSGVKTWAVRFRSPTSRKPAKLTIGRYPALGLADARMAAQSALRLVAEGIDPIEQKRDARAAADTVGELSAEFLRRHVEPNLRPNTQQQVRRDLAAMVAAFGPDRKVADVGRKDVIRLVDKITDERGGIAANRALSTIKKFYSWLLARGEVDQSPAIGVAKPASEVVRDRVLSSAEIARLWNATADASTFSAFVRLLLLTGQRRLEVAQLRWSELDLDGPEPTWHLPGARAKNGKDHDIPLSGAVVEILRGLPRFAGSDFALTANGRNPFAGYHVPKARLDPLMDGPWRLHDIRRSVATNLARIGVAIHIVEALLNHSSGSKGGLVSVYQRYDYAAEKRLALALWAVELDRIVDPSTAGNVVAFRRG